MKVNPSWHSLKSERQRDPGECFELGDIPAIVALVMSQGVQPFSHSLLTSNSPQTKVVIDKILGRRNYEESDKMCTLSTQYGNQENWYT
jgi:hypothetical protein